LILCITSVRRSSTTHWDVGYAGAKKLPMQQLC